MSDATPATETLPPSEKLPPFVQIVKTPESCQVNHNLVDPWLAAGAHGLDEAPTGQADEWRGRTDGEDASSLGGCPQDF